MSNPVQSNPGRVLSDTADARRGRSWKRFRLAMLGVYAVLLVASAAWMRGHAAAAKPDSERADYQVLRTPVPLMTSAGRAAPSQTIEMAVCQWGEVDQQGAGRLPVILLHGGPGRGREFESLAGLLKQGRVIYAPDLLGFGDTVRDVPDYSILANARTVLAWMDANCIAKAHVLGWSQGGGVALHMADLQPARVASLTMFASIGVQETEGSRSHAFERVRYELGDYARRAIPWLIPSFGAIREAPPAFTRFFLDSDQRPLRDVMRRLRTPTLIIQGKRDFLVNAWAAKEHARLIQGSKLIITEGTHFVPYWPLDQRAAAAGWLLEFWGNVEAGKALQAPLLEPEEPMMPLERMIIGLPWWVVAGLLAALGARKAEGTRWGTVIGALLIFEGLADYGVVLAGLWGGATAWLFRQAWKARRRGLGRVAVEEWDERAARGVLWAGMLGVLRPDLRAEVGHAVGDEGRRRVLMGVGALVGLWLHRLLMLLVALIVCSWVVRELPHSWSVWGVAAGAVSARVVMGILDGLLTLPGRRMLWASVVRAARFEFWPTWVVYLGIVPTFVRCAVRARHPLAWTACNAGIENGGGTVGESKFGIISALRRGAMERNLPKDLQRACCRTWRIEAGDAPERAAVVDEIVHNVEHELRYPVVLKPDVGQRGASVRVARSRGDLKQYFDGVAGPVLLQPWHPGPGEVGVLWLRRPRGEARADDQAGSIFSITLKNFSFVEGDGERTIERLIYEHKRFRLQAGRFVARLAGHRLNVLGVGERVPIALAGNHCQGTLFRDGAHLITPELERSVDSLCRAFCGRAERDGLDAARLDIRYRSEEDLRAGRLDADSIVEMNGTFGETTNIYDPDKPVSWSLDYLRRQWEAMYALGRERMDEGKRALSMWGFLRILARSFGRARGSDMAD